MRPHTTITGLALASMLLAGCGSAQGTPAVDPTAAIATARAQETEDAFAGSEKAIRDYYAEIDKWANEEMPARPYASHTFREQHNQAVRDLKASESTAKGKDKDSTGSPQRPNASQVSAWKKENKASIAETAKHFNLPPTIAKRWCAVA